MSTTRFLLPFTHGVDVDALEHALLFAQAHNATLLPLALIPVSKRHWPKGARLEHIQQAKDFLEAVQQKATRYNIPVERFEVFTSDVTESIAALSRQLSCQALLLFLNRKGGCLLHTSEVQQLRATAPCTLYIIHLSEAHKKWKEMDHLPDWLASQITAHKSLQHLPPQLQSETSEYEQIYSVDPSMSREETEKNVIDIQL